MKFFYILLVVLLVPFYSWAQAPEKMSYQAIIRNSNNELVKESEVNIQISILRGHASGFTVYSESHKIKTNSGGLAALEIGTGSTNDNFSEIDWAIGPYFIKTETDPNGGFNYSITNTSQLLSVPYALYAKTAEEFIGELTETDPVYDTSVAAGITAADTLKWNNKLDNYTELDPLFAASVAASISEVDTNYWNSKLDSITELDPVYAASIASQITSVDTTNWNNKLDTEIDGSITNEIQTISRTGTTVTLSNGGGTFTDSVKVYKGGINIEISNDTIYYKPQLKIGDFYGGGVIFWLNPTREMGLVVSTEDLSDGIEWGVYGDYLNFKQSSWNGKANTDSLIALQTPETAATLCGNYSGGGYKDWYLPTAVELNMLFNNVWLVNRTLEIDGDPLTTEIVADWYWSSNEYDRNNAYSCDMSEGEYDWDDKDDRDRVRAIRFFTIK